MHVALQDIDQALDAIADAIEGGNTYRGSGTAFTGIPGALSNDDGLRTGSDASVTASSNGSTTSLPYSSGDWDNTRWVRDDLPPYFAICTSATNAENEAKARKITAWDNSGKTFTVAAFPQAISSGDEFTIAEGFKRILNDRDKEETQMKGLDRTFALNAEVGDDIGFTGRDRRSFRTDLEIRLRVLKHHREVDARKSAMRNALIIREALGKQANIDTTYLRAIFSSEGSQSVDTDDQDRVTIVITVPMVYSVANSF